MTAQGKNTPWYKKWFNEFYLEVYAHRDEREAERQVDFSVKELGLSRSSLLLDLACGAGRHLDAFNKRGVPAVGADLSFSLLSQAAGQKIVRADMRRIPFLNSVFSAVTLFFTSFGYFENDAENISVLNEAGRVLQPGGRILVDLINRDFLLKNLVEKDTRQLKGYVVTSQRNWNSKAGRIEKKIRVEKNGTVENFSESVRVPERNEISDWLCKTGFTLINVSGDFSGRDLTPDAERMIVVAEWGS